MTLPAAYPLDWNQICGEFSLNPATAIFPRDFYGKGGAPAAGTLSFGDFLGRSGGQAYSPIAGNYTRSDNGLPNGSSGASFTVTANASVVWTWSATGTNAASVSASIASGGSAASFTVSLPSANTTATRSATVTITSGGQSWTINLAASGTGAGGGGGTCVTAATPILVANDNEKLAADLAVGDYVYTRHEKTLEWGLFRVSAIEFALDSIYAAPGHPNATRRHRFALPAAIARLLPERLRWYRAGWIGRRIGVAMVAKITVEDAHTYVAKSPGGSWRLSHNIKP